MLLQAILNHPVTNRVMEFEIKPENSIFRRFFDD